MSAGTRAWALQRRLVRRRMARATEASAAALERATSPAAAALIAQRWASGERARRRLAANPYAWKRHHTFDAPTGTANIDMDDAW